MEITQNKKQQQVLMAFEMIKGFQAVKAAVHRFAGSRTKLADDFSVIGVASGALNRLLLKHFFLAKLLFGIGRSDTKGF